MGLCEGAVLVLAWLGSEKFNRVVARGVGGLGGVFTGVCQCAVNRPMRGSWLGDWMT